MTGVTGTSQSTRETGSPHSLESQVHRELTTVEGMKISSLVIRRIEDGVCLEGIMEVDAPESATKAALRIAGVGRVQNNLLSHSDRKPRRKG